MFHSADQPVRPNWPTRAKGESVVSQSQPILLGTIAKVSNLFLGSISLYNFELSPYLTFKLKSSTVGFKRVLMLVASFK